MFLVDKSVLKKQCKWTQKLWCTALCNSPKNTNVESEKGKSSNILSMAGTLYPSAKCQAFKG